MKNKNSLKEFLLKEQQAKKAFKQFKEQQKIEAEGKLEKLIINYKNKYPFKSNYDILEMAKKELYETQQEEFNRFVRKLEKKS